MAQYIKFVQEPAGFKMYIRLEKGAEPFPESRCDSYWFCDFDKGYCWHQKEVDGDDSNHLSNLKCVPNFKAIVENESDVDANGVRRLKVGQILVKLKNDMKENCVKRVLGIRVRDDFVNVLGESLGSYSCYSYGADEISASHAISKCPEILAWNAAPAAPAVTPVAENANAFAREEIALLREIAEIRSKMYARQWRADAIKAAAQAPPAAPAVTPVIETANSYTREEIARLHEIAEIRSEMHARQWRADAIKAAAIRNLDEKTSAK